ncbi:MAG: hypothetical protein E6K18_08930, partial [Methanobacteriota archaeon]
MARIWSGLGSAFRPYGGETRVLNVAISASTVYFGADDGTVGSELWTSDGTAAGTVLVKDINAGVSSNGDAFLRKYSPDGNALWTAQFGVSIGAAIRSLATYSGAVYAAGSEYGVLAGQNGADGFGAFVRSYDSTGSEQWTHQFGYYGVDIASGVAADASGVYVTGYT